MAAASAAFDGERASSMVEELRGSFNAGRTRSYDWRVKQLKAIEKMIVEKEKDIMDSLFSDLSKPQFESFLHEVGSSVP